MSIYQIFVAGKQRGPNYTNIKLALQNAEVIARASKRVHVYEVKDGIPSSTKGMWVDGKRIK